MTTYAAALTCILENVSTMPIADVPLAQSHGQVLAQDVFAPKTLPESAAAGPDGYALRAADLAGATREHPVPLRIQEIVHAGHLPRRTIQPGTASRIMTGSTLPVGADCVVRFEDTDEPADKNGPNQRNPTTVQIYVAPPAGTGTMPAGHLVRKDSLVAPRGTVIGTPQLSALSALGLTRVPVFRRPVVAILCTGDELVSTGHRLPPGKVYNSNGPALAASVAQHGGIPKLLGIARDNQLALETRLQHGFSADVILTSGGVSKGDFDLVRLTIAKFGRVHFHRLHMGPGASFSFGAVNAADGRTMPVFALAGPPSGCLINFETLVRPAMSKMLGYTTLTHPEVEARAEDGAICKAPFPFVRYVNLVRTEAGYRVRFGEIGGPGNLISLATSNALVVLDPGTSILPGDTVRVFPFDCNR